MVRFKKTNRKAISPIIATVLIIAVTLIAAVAIGGFVFGLFGSSTNTAQVQAVSAAIPATTSVTSNTFTATCTKPSSGTYGTIQFANTGTVNVNIISLTLTYNGQTYSQSGLACGVAPGSASPTGVYITVLPVAPTSGVQYSGYVVTSNGAQVVFTGAFQ